MKADYTQRQLQLMKKKIEFYLAGRSSLYDTQGDLMALFLAIEDSEKPASFRDLFMEVYSDLEQIIALEKENDCKEEIIKTHIPNLQSLIEEYLIKK